MTPSVSSAQLGTLPVGFAGTIERFDEDTNPDTEDRVDQLREMGFAEGLSVEILHQNSFGRDPIAVRVGSMTIALRRKEANLITVSAK